MFSHSSINQSFKEHQSIQQEKEALLQEIALDGPSKFLFTSANLSDLTTDIANVLQPRTKQVSSHSGDFLLTKTTLYNLKQVGLCLSMKVPIMLQGERGCGKTSLVDYLASHLAQEGL